MPNIFEPSTNNSSDTMFPSLPALGASQEPQKKKKTSAQPWNLARATDDTLKAAGTGVKSALGFSDSGEGPWGGFSQVGANALESLPQMGKMAYAALASPYDKLAPVAKKLWYGNVPPDAPTPSPTPAQPPQGATSVSQEADPTPPVTATPHTGAAVKPYYMTHGGPDNPQFSQYYKQQPDQYQAASGYPITPQSFGGIGSQHSPSGMSDPAGNDYSNANQINTPLGSLKIGGIDLGAIYDRLNQQRGGSMGHEERMGRMVEAHERQGLDLGGEQLRGAREMNEFNPMLHSEQLLEGAKKIGSMDEDQALKVSEMLPMFKGILPPDEYQAIVDSVGKRLSGRNGGQTQSQPMQQASQAPQKHEQEGFAISALRGAVPGAAAGGAYKMLQAAAGLPALKALPGVGKFAPIVAAFISSWLANKGMSTIDPQTKETNPWGELAGAAAGIFGGSKLAGMKGTPKTGAAPVNPPKTPSPNKPYDTGPQTPFERDPQQNFQGPPIPQSVGQIGAQTEQASMLPATTNRRWTHGGGEPGVIDVEEVPKGQSQPNLVTPKQLPAPLTPEQSTLNWLKDPSAQPKTMQELLMSNDPQIQAALAQFMQQLQRQ